MTAEAAPRVWADVFTKPATTPRTVPGCTHSPACPTADRIDHDAARRIAHDYTGGYSILCNGVVLFEDTGELMPDGSSVEPHRGPAPHCTETGHGHACPCDPEEN